MHKAASDGVNALDDKGIGVITPRMPNSYYNLLCFLIAYKTGTNLTDVMEMNYFDFISYLYIVGKFSEEGTPDGGTPEMRDVERKLGL